MTKDLTKDLTTGRPLKLIFQFAIPVLMGMLLQQVYALVDTAIVGRTLGVLALGGVGATGSLNFMVIGFCNGLCSGLSIPVAQAFGAGDEGQLRRYVANGVMLCAAIASVMLLAILPNCRRILTLMNTTKEQFGFAYSYIFIIFCGVPATMLYNLTAGILRALGDSKTPVRFLALSSALNIVLDLVTILVFNMGVAGAALATVVSQLISGLACLVYMKKHFPILHMEKPDWKPLRKELSTLFGQGVPMGLQFSITAIGSVMLTSAVNSLGPRYVSASASSNKINHIFLCGYQAIGATSANFCGQNLGAKQYDRIRQGVHSCLMLATVFACIHVITVWFGTRLFLLLFLRAEEIGQVIDLVRLNTICYALGGFVLQFIESYRQAIQGMSFTKLALCAGMLEMIMRTLCAVWGVPNYGYLAAALSGTMAWVAASAFLVPTFYLCLRKRRREGGMLRVKSGK